MKKTLLISILALTASLAHAGGACCQKDSGKEDKSGCKAESSSFVDATAVLAGGGCCAKGGEKGEKPNDSEAISSSVLLSAVACGGKKDGKGCGKDADSAA